MGFPRHGADEAGGQGKPCPYEKPFLWGQRKRCPVTGVRPACNRPNGAALCGFRLDPDQTLRTAPHPQDRVRSGWLGLLVRGADAC